MMQDTGWQTQHLLSSGSGNNNLMAAPLLLHIETSSPVCSVALSLGSSLLSLKETTEHANHAAMLIVMIEQVLQEAKYDAKMLDAIVLSAGPGSYTGLRIGTATAKGMCYALNKPLIAVDSLQALANGMRANAGERKCIYCPTIDARRNEIYYGLYSHNVDIIRPPVNHILAPGFLSDMQGDEKILIGGSGATKCRQFVSVHRPEFDEITTPSAKWMIQWGDRMFASAAFTDPIYFEPHYIKPAFVTSAKKIL